MKSYNHFSKNERLFIDQWYNVDHKSIREIAKLLNKSPSSVSREINRNLVNGDYVYLIADKKANERTWHNHSMYLAKYKKFTELFLKHYDKRTFGVYPTMHLIKSKYPWVKQPSCRQVFRWIKQDRWAVKMRNRLRWNYKPGGKRSNGFWSNIYSRYVQPFWVRPKEIDSRKTFGHWELDLIIGKKSNGYKNIITLNERKTRMLFTSFVWTKLPWKVSSAIWKLIKKHDLPIKTITIDNGVEFEKIALVGKWADCIIYKCEAFASFQRGSNENLNGFIRRYWKKGTDFNDFNDNHLQEITNKINEMPRRIFKWKSSKEMYEKEKAALLAAKSI